jgi:hypothetical protein
VNTRIVDSGRNRPPELQNPVGQVAPLAANPAREEFVRQLVANGMAPEQVADLVFAAIREDKFYIFTHPEMKLLIQRRMENILNERNPAIGFA